nr:MAG: RNA-dependent RNA polymerase [Porcine picobirnavirus]UAW00537.1 MAG: RNA-dependent RNA polymerase [Porcine picobirnavirus]
MTKRTQEELNQGKQVDVSPQWQQCFKLPNKPLEGWFSKVRAGSNEEVRGTLFSERSVGSVLQAWNSHLKKVADKWPTLYEFECDLRKKVGPMSIQKPLSERLDDIDHYYSDVSDPGEPIDAKAIDAALEEWDCSSPPNIWKPLDTIRAMKLSTNSGAPYFGRRRAVLNKTYPSSVWVDTKGIVRQDLKYTSWEACAILGWRGQEGGPEPDDVKQRVIWMMPFAVNIAELQVYKPLIEYAQHNNLVPAWVSEDAVDAEITKLFDTKEEDDLVVCTDFSRFDQHFNENLAAASKRLLSQLFVASGDMDDWLNEVFPIKYCIPLAYDWDTIRTGKHGMASGSGGTNADETLAHRCLQYEAAQSAGSELNRHSMCLGDDGVLTYPGISVESVVDTYTKHGLEMNVDKQYASTEDCVYLRRWHHKDYRINDVCVGVYSTMRALGRLMEQERYYPNWSEKMVALRQLSILENVKYHPLNEEFVRFCMKGDKYRLGLDIPGFLSKIDSIAEQAKEDIPGFGDWRKDVQSKTTPMSESWIVNYLKSLK